MTDKNDDTQPPKKKRKISEETRLKNLERGRLWRLDHKEQQAEYFQKYREEHAEELNAYNRQYHADHKEAKNANRKAWSEKNKEKEQAGRKQWYQENKDGKYLDTRLRSKYGITVDQYNELLKNQDGHCALCDRTDAGTSDKRRLHVDHTHDTNIVRGLLCHFHNTAVGALAEDPTQFSEKIQEYLKGNPLGMSPKPT